MTGLTRARSEVSDVVYKDRKKRTVPCGSGKKYKEVLRLNRPTEAMIPRSKPFRASNEHSDQIGLIGIRIKVVPAPFWVNSESLLTYFLT
jgi:hypothetical protein